MHQTHKPTRNELYKKLSAAREAMRAGRRSIANGEANRHVEADMEELEIASRRDYWQLVFECILLALESPAGCFRPTSPPKSTKDGDTKNLFLWPFEVYHEDREQFLYFKFCLKKQSDGTHYLHIDCHESRPKKI
ncbi:MAG: hypothetical protein ACOCUY_03645 [Verrucomicrobiota bacterium]